ncbi:MULTISPECIES: DUF3043 domain-containing protein [unclassified Dietzia]|uniref:DUF3043 domain-containing protein n=1 Tax=unclassified Dietzia TaxID=2617939 RepID=UPI0015F95D0D|nr:DUF3043 domain-containing protein [Dietzia sp. DQ12-76]MBB1024625.1 DUF3043 domain-containing protein [Dietzia sp. DQ12-76]MBB1027829.1 DUF3043 domain-containing protein [Dietzia sp. DQ11-38-2]
MKLRAFGSSKDDPGKGSTGSDSGPESSPGAAAAGAGADSAAPAGDARRPAGKGKPTPRRRDQERARGLRTGPVTAPVTRKEAKERRKAARANMSKDERRASKAEERAAREERRQLMMAGDDRYVLSRDRGEVRRFARDWVDTHRRLINFFMPLALFVIIFQLIPNPALMFYSQNLFLILIVVVVVDGILLGRKVNSVVRERFPGTEDTGFGMGWYAVMRATQPRMLRTPRPRVRPGDSI